MITTKFADHSTLKNLTNVKTENNSDAIVWPNILVCSSAQHYEKTIAETSLTFISNQTGETNCRVDRKSFKICASTYLVVNPFHKMDYSINSDSEVHTTNIHVNYSFIKGIYQYHFGSDRFLLEDFPSEMNPEIPLFFHELQYKSPAIAQSIHALSKSSDVHVFEEQLANIWVQLMMKQLDCVHKLTSIKSRKKTTQEELYKKISTAKDIIFYSYHQPLTIEQLSKEVALSKFHFTRLFKDTYGVSPYQFLKIVRLEKAKELLSNDHYTLQEIAVAIGFEEGNSFINAFKSLYGMYPTEYRMKNKHV